MSDQTQLPPNGPYLAWVQCESHGEFRHHVHVLDGEVMTVHGQRILPSACRGFEAITDQVPYWPAGAAIEIYALRTANAGLLKEVGRLTDEVERLEAWKASVVAIEAKWDSQAIAAMLGSRLGESTRTAIQREVPLLLDRVKQLHAAGQDAVDYIDGKHRDAGRVLDGWRKANQ